MGDSNVTFGGLFGSYLRLCDRIGQSVLTALLGSAARRRGDTAEITRTIFGSVVVGTPTGASLGVVLALLLDSSVVPAAVFCAAAGAVLLGVLPAGALLMFATYRK
jgi:hypothetical protein